MWYKETNGELKE